METVKSQECVRRRGCKRLPFPEYRPVFTQVFCKGQGLAQQSMDLHGLPEGWSEAQIGADWATEKPPGQAADDRRVTVSRSLDPGPGTR